MAKISLLPKIANPTGRELVVVADPVDENKTKGVDVGALASAAAAPAVAMANRYANDTTDTDVVGGPAGSRGAAFRVAQASTLVDTAYDVQQELGRGPAIVNLYDPARRTTGMYVNTDGSIANQAGWQLSDLMRVKPGGSYTIALGSRYRFVTAAGAFVAGSYGTTANAATIVAPPTARYLQTSIPTNPGDARQMVVAGAVLPTSYAAPGFRNPFAARTATAAVALAAVDARSPVGINIVDPARFSDGYAMTPATGGAYAVAGYTVSDSGPATGTGIVASAIPVRAGTAYVANAGLIIAFLDVDGVWVDQKTVSAGVPFTTPDTAAFIRFHLNPINAKATLMIVQGSIAPASYQAFGYPTVSAVNLTALVAARRAAALSRADDANVLNASSIVPYQALTTTNGGVYGQAGYSRTGMIEVNPGDYVAATVGTNAAAYYDQNGSYVGAPGLKASFFGSIAANGAMNVSAVYGTGKIEVGDVLSGGQVVTGFGTGSGGTGTYTTSATAAVAGTLLYTQPSFTAQIDGNIMTVSAIANAGNVIVPGLRLSAAGIANGTYVRCQISGTAGGVGTYWVTVTQTIASIAMTGLAGAWDGGWLLVPAGAYFYQFQQSPVTGLATATVRQGRAAYVDGAKFQATISGDTLTIIASTSGRVNVGDLVYAAGVVGIAIKAMGTSTGGVGTVTLASAPGDSFVAIAMRSAPAPIVASKAFGGGGAVYPRAGARAGYLGNSQTNNLLFQGAVEQNTGMTRVFNSGWPGYDIAGLLSKVASLPLTTIDVLVITEGHNEWGGASRPLGSMADASGAATTYGQMKALLDACYAANPDLLIVVTGPTYRGPCTISGVTYTADTTANARGVTGKQIDDAMRDVAEAYAAIFVELRKRSNINAATVMRWTGEGLHWTGAGAPRVGRIIAGAINSAA